MNYPEEFVARKARFQAALSPLAVLVVAQLPFLGVYKNLAQGTIESIQWIYLAVALTIATFLLWMIAKAIRVKFGYDKEQVFFQGLFKKRRIRWEDICKVEIVGEEKSMDVTDLVDEYIPTIESGLMVSICSDNSRINIPKYYSEAETFTKAVLKKTGLKLQHAKISKSFAARLLDYLQIIT